MKKYFVGTSYLVAYSYDKDKYHNLALIKMKEIEQEETSVLFTSDYVIDEFLNITIRLSGIGQAIKWGKLLYSGKFMHIIYTNEKILSSSWEIFQKEVKERKPMNMTDCVVFVVSQSLNCDKILTYDERLKNYRYD